MESEANIDTQTSSDWISRPIKHVTLKQIEQAFSKALGELTGKAYDVTITKLDLNPSADAWVADVSQIDLTLRSPRDDKLPF